MVGLALFGLLAVLLMVLSYALAARSNRCVRAGAGALGSTYRLLQSAWPFGIIEAIWSIVALRGWHAARMR